MHRILARILTSIVLSSSCLYSQSQAINGVIEGRVLDERGTVLPGVVVAIKNRDNGAERVIQTDDSGRYRAPLLPLGNYEVAAQRSGFTTTRRSGISLEIAQTLNVGFTMKSGLQGEGTTQTGRSSLVELDRKQPSTTINKRFVERLPLSGRKFLDLGIMVPGATEFGDRDTSATADFVGVNHFYSNMLVDGADAFQAWSNLPRGKFLVPFEFSQNAIREFQVLNGNFTAEFGRSAGGLINVVTKSGTNEWHGDGFYYVSDSSLNATPRFAGIKPDTRQQQFGASIGGPVIRDQLFVFGNYDQQVRTEPMIVTSGTVLNGFDTTLASIGDPVERQRVLQARDFVQSLTGDFDRDLDQIAFLVKTDWLVNPRQTVSLRYNYQDFLATNVPENGFGLAVVSGMALSNVGRAKVRNDSGVLQWTSLISSRISNEARFQLALGRERETSTAEGPQVRVGSRNAGFTFGRREIFPALLDEDRWQWVDNLAFIRGRHEIKTGLDIQRISDRSYSLTAMTGAYQFNSLRDFANGRYISYMQGFGIPESTTVNPYYSFFVQDNIKVSPALSVNLGLRYELQDLERPSVSNPQFAQSAQLRDDKNNFAPRFGFAWSPGSQKTVLRGSYGVYHAPLPIQVNAVAKTQNAVVQNLREYVGPADRRGPSPGAPQYPGIIPAEHIPQPLSPGARIVVFSPDSASPYVQQINLELEREILDDLTVSSGWLFSKGTRLRRNEDINLFFPTLRTLEVRDAARNIFSLIEVPSFDGPASRPFPFFDRITEFKFDSNSVYHAFFMQVNKRYSHGVQFLSNYTLSKLIDLGQAPGNQITCCTSQNPFFHRDERGLGRRDQRHRFNLALLWDLPHVASENRLARNLLQDWRINSIIKTGSGRPFSPTVAGDSGGDINGDANRGDRAPLFGRNTFTGPGYASIDLGAQRVFRIDENKSVTLGIEIFNLFNRANYLRPATDYFNLINVPGGPARLEGPLPSFGSPQDATRSREVQLAARFLF